MYKNSPLLRFFLTYINKVCWIDIPENRKHIEEYFAEMEGLS